jgi:hypothetical protein
MAEKGASVMERLVATRSISIEAIQWFRQHQQHHGFQHSGSNCRLSRTGHIYVGVYP